MLRSLAAFTLWTLISGSCLNAAELPWLSARGDQLVDEAGNAIVLRSISLGGWLVEETWMQPFVTQPPSGGEHVRIVDHATLWSTIEGRLGQSAMERVRSQFREAWINETDFERIHADGFNCVRLPFLYDLLDEPDGWAWLDRAVEWARKHRVYIILDLHGAPGGQSKDQHTGWSDQNQLFSEEQFIAHTERVWQRVAERYRDTPDFAAFDLLNEPMGAPDRDTLYRVQDRLYKAVRSVDHRHVIVIEDGYTGLNHMPIPSERAWQNVMASSHHYQFRADSERHQIEAGKDHVDYMKRGHVRLGVPMFLGEFNHEPWGSPRSLSTMIEALERQKVSWALWTYKLVQAHGTQTMWAVYRNEQPVEPVDPFRDSEQEIIDKCQRYRTAKLQAYPGLLDAIILD